MCLLTEHYSCHSKMTAEELKRISFLFLYMFAEHKLFNKSQRLLLLLVQLL